MAAAAPVAMAAATPVAVAAAAPVAMAACSARAAPVAMAAAAPVAVAAQQQRHQAGRTRAWPRPSMMQSAARSPKQAVAPEQARKSSRRRRRGRRRRRRSRHSRSSRSSSSCSVDPSAASSGRFRAASPGWLGRAALSRRPLAEDSAAPSAAAGSGGCRGGGESGESGSGGVGGAEGGGGGKGVERRSKQMSAPSEWLARTGVSSPPLQYSKTGL